MHHGVAQRAADAQPFGAQRARAARAPGRSRPRRPGPRVRQSSRRCRRRQATSACLSPVWQPASLAGERDIMRAAAGPKPRAKATDRNQDRNHGLAFRAARGAPRPRSHRAAPRCGDSRRRAAAGPASRPRPRWGRRNDHDVGILRVRLQRRQRRAQVHRDGAGNALGIALGLGPHVAHQRLAAVLTPAHQLLDRQPRDHAQLAHQHQRRSARTTMYNASSAASRPRPMAP